MLSIAPITAGQEGYYLALAREDYYLQGGEPPGRWLGSASEKLGLEAFSAVDKEHASKLFQGHHPTDPDVSLRQHQNYAKRRKQVAWDLTFSAPKSISILWAFGDRQTRAAIQESQLEAVATALRYVEDSAAFTRRGAQGVEREQVTLIGASFEHGTSRAQDPQLHTHLLLFNAGHRADGTWGTIVSKLIYEEKMTLGALYRAALAHELKKRLAVSLVATKTAFEISTIPARLIEHFSKRAKAILEALGEGAERASAKLKEVACKSTRSEKGHLARSDLFSFWASEARKLGVVLPAISQVQPLNEAEYRKDLDESRLALQGIESILVNVLNRRVGFFTESQAIRAVLDELGHLGLPPGEIIEETKAVLHPPQQSVVSEALEEALEQAKFVVRTDSRYQKLGEHRRDKSLVGRYVARRSKSLLRELTASRSPRIVKIGTWKGRAIFTTTSLLRMERFIRAFALRSSQETKHSVSAATIEAVLKRPFLSTRRLGSVADALKKVDRHHLTQEQYEALLVITYDKGAVKCIDGLAGTGKTYVLAPAYEIWRRKNKRVIGTAVAGAASANLQAASGIPSENLERLLTRLKHGHEKLDANTVVVLDEASMVSTKQMYELVRHVRKSKAKLVLVGDTKQLPPIGVGVPYRNLVDTVGGAKLVDIQRQKVPWLRKATRELANGNVRTALARYSERNRLTIKKVRHEAISALIDSWAEHGTPDLRKTLILASTNEDVDRINNLARRHLLREGKLGKDPIKFYRLGKVVGTFYQGERVVFERAVKSLGVETGDTGTIKKVHRGSESSGAMTITMDREVPATFGGKKNKTVRISSKNMDAVRLGYATTVHRAQGQTVDKAFILAGGWMQNFETSYVQLSRVRYDCFLFADRSSLDEDSVALHESMQREQRRQDLAQHHDTPGPTGMHR